MNERELAISILQKARDALSDRLTARIIESHVEIDDDATGVSYLSEIETIYDQLAGRLAHVNAMLSNLPATAPHVEVAASEIVYADMANASPVNLELESASVAMLALPAPAGYQEPALAEPVEPLSAIVAHVQAGELMPASRALSELFDIKPSRARRAVTALSRQMAEHAELARRICDLGARLPDLQEHAAAAAVSQYFEFSLLQSLTIVREIRARQGKFDKPR